MNTETEFYPMPSFPTLAVRDLVASARWYQNVLGFQLVFQMPGPSDEPVLVHLRWTKYADLLLVPDTNQATASRGIGVTLTFAMGDNSIDQFFTDIVAKGADNTMAPINQPWNVREVTILDPDGYRLTFTEPINKQLPIDQVIENMKQSFD